MPAPHSRSQDERPCGVDPVGCTLSPGRLPLLGFKRAVFRVECGAGAGL